MRAVIQALDASALFAIPPGELSIVTLDARAMSRLHDQFMHDPSPTDVITFDGDSLAETAGEVCVCPDVAADYAAAEKMNFAEELTLYIVHGCLHLAGFDDRNATDRRAMRAAEQRAMAVVRSAGVVPRFRLRRTL